MTFYIPVRWLATCSSCGKVNSRTATRPEMDKEFRVPKNVIPTTKCQHCGVHVALFWNRDKENKENTQVIKSVTTTTRYEPTVDLGAIDTGEVSIQLGKKMEEIIARLTLHGVFTPK